jgi:hypothetical protein
VNGTLGARAILLAVPFALIAPLGGCGDPSVQAAPADAGGDGTLDAVVLRPDGGGDGSASFACAAPAPSNTDWARDSCGIFVAPGTGGGNDGQVGTLQKPLASASRAIALTQGTGRRVFVCAGTYAEALVVQGAKGAVAIHGIACDGGTPTFDTSKKPVFAPVDGKPALAVDGASGGSAALVFDNVELRSAPGDAAHPNSIAVAVHDAGNVLLRNARLVAQAGADGLAGDDGSVRSNHFAGKVDGNAATSTTGGTELSCACPNRSVSEGGRGGDGQVGATPPQDGAAGSASPAFDFGPTGGKGGAGERGGGDCARGRTGASGKTEAPATQPPKLGTLGEGVWTASPGANASDGQTAQGGGGGGGNAASTARGGGGGACGGCGGAGARGGTGGGSSIALLSVGSRISVEGSTLTSRAAGRGGIGGKGQTGANGGAGAADE